MRESRIKVDGENAVYHVIDRCGRGRFDLEAADKEKLVELMRQAVLYTGCEVLTYAVLDNHMHTLLFVRGDSPAELSDEVILKRVGALYGKEEVAYLRGLLAACEHDEVAVRERALVLYEGERAKHERRMHDVSAFVKIVKQRFAAYWNKSRKTFGRFWADRFKSVLVENTPEALRTVAAYIDLNAVRAGIVKDPKDYRWCGYGEAVAGRKRSREGLKVAIGERDWRVASREYRKLLFGMGSERVMDSRGRPKRQIREDDVRAVEEQGGELGLPALLRCRVRYFSAGLVLGSEAFVEGIFEKRREWFGEKRKKGARRLKGGEWGELRVMRDLRSEVID